MNPGSASSPPPTPQAAQASVFLPTEPAVPSVQAGLAHPAPPAAPNYSEQHRDSEQRLPVEPALPISPRSDDEPDCQADAESPYPEAPVENAKGGWSSFRRDLFG